MDNSADPSTMPTETCDLFVIGGGINGCGIARDAAGRGLSVVLAEMNDLASATSSASTKLFHGGLRYLEYFEARLVREALKEREVLLRAMPHISRPMRFVLPLADDMRFETDTPVSRLLGVVMPWLKGRRPAWLIRLGLFLYDHIGGRELLPPTSRVDLGTAPEGQTLQRRFERAFEYSDCWVDDARLVVLNARDAQAHGATILTNTEVLRATRVDEAWDIDVTDRVTGHSRTIRARMLVNAGGPWVGQIIQSRVQIPSTEGVRLVRGSHIVTRRLFDHDKCYFFQGRDGRIVFAIPYEDDFTLIGTTDQDHPNPSIAPVCTEAEQDYLCAFVSEYFRKPVTRDDIVWTFSGVRPLHDDGAGKASAATRDYTLTVDAAGGAPVLNVFGGKITTYRRLAESAMAQIGAHFPGLPPAWTADAALPGGDFPVGGVERLIDDLQDAYPFLSRPWARRMVRAYGTDAAQVLGQAEQIGDLGRDFGATLTQREVEWMIRHEFASTADDILWRRSKLGLRLSGEQVENLESWLTQNV